MPEKPKQPSRQELGAHIDRLAEALDQIVQLTANEATFLIANTAIQQHNKWVKKEFG